VKRMVKQHLGWRAPRGMGWLTSPKRGAHNRIYDQTSVSLWSLLKKTLQLGEVMPSLGVASG